MQDENPIEVGDSEETAVDVDLEEKKVVDDNKQAELKLETTDDKKEDELEQYSDNVKSRINKLTHRYREEERQKQEAIKFAENVKKRNEELEKRLQRLDEGYQEEFNTRVQSQLDVAKKVLRDAHESGDVDKIVEAQEALANLSVDKVRLATAKKQAEDSAAQTVEADPVATQQAQPQQPQKSMQQVFEEEPLLKDWVQKNDWFGKDEVMTYAARLIDDRLVNQEGFDPMSDEYYAEIDKRMAAEFPHKFNKNVASRKVASAESSASRRKGGQKTVRLTPSQVAIAKRLNVPLEEYAKYV